MLRALISIFPAILVFSATSPVLSADIASDTLTNDQVLPALKNVLDGKGNEKSVTVDRIIGIYQEGKVAIIYASISGKTLNTSTIPPTLTTSNRWDAINCKHLNDARWYCEFSDDAFNFGQVFILSTP
jgi:hypothetical protein